MESRNHFSRVEKATKAEDLYEESLKQGFLFPVPDKIHNLKDEDVIVSEEGGFEVSKKELLKLTQAALQDAWCKAVQPRINAIRQQAIDREAIKHGTDFFTEADILSEEAIRNNFLEALGEENVRIFGEEKGAYVGNIDSRIGIRIDPIDGTESMKFGKTQDWSIMIGVYEGTLEQETQIIGAMYFPERSILVYQVDSLPEVFILDTETGETIEIGNLNRQDDLKQIVTCFWKHSDLRRQGPIDRIESSLRIYEARLRSTNSASADVLEALTTGGQRAIIMDGDITTVDYIAYSILQKLGYRTYTWEGEYIDADDTSVTDKKVIFVPEGKAGEEIREVVIDSVQTEAAFTKGVY